MSAGMLDLPGVGEQLGNLEYVIDNEDLASYRGLVGGSGHFPNLLANDCSALLSGRCAGNPVTTVWQRFDFLRPPVLGRRVQVGGWLRDLQERSGVTRLRVNAFAVDEIGTEILRSEAVFVVGQVEHTPRSVPHYPTYEANVACGRFADAMPGDVWSLDKFNLPDDHELSSYLESARGLSGLAVAHGGKETASLVAGWLEGLLGREFGDDFRWGGRLSVAYHVPARPGDVLTADAVVMGRETNATGTTTGKLVVSVRNQLNVRVVTSEVSVKVPSPRLL